MTSLTKKQRQELLKEAEWREWVIGNCLSLHRGVNGMEDEADFAMRTFVTPLLKAAQGD